MSQSPPAVHSVTSDQQHNTTPPTKCPARNARKARRTQNSAKTTDRERTKSSSGDNNHNNNNELSRKQLPSLSTSDDDNVRVASPSAMAATTATSSSDRETKSPSSPRQSFETPSDRRVGGGGGGGGKTPSSAAATGATRETVSASINNSTVSLEGISPSRQPPPPPQPTSRVISLSVDKHLTAEEKAVAIAAPASPTSTAAEQKHRLLSPRSPTGSSVDDVIVVDTPPPAANPSRGSQQQQQQQQPATVIKAEQPQPPSPPTSAKPTTTSAPASSAPSTGKQQWIQPTLFGGGKASELLKREVQEKDAKIDELQRELGKAGDRISALETEIAQLRGAAKHAEEVLKEYQGQSTRLARYQDIMRNVMVDSAKTQRREARRKENTGHFETGNVVLIPGNGLQPATERWVFGTRPMELMEELKAVVARREQVEEARKQSMKQVKTEEKKVDSVVAVVGGVGQPPLNPDNDNSNGPQLPHSPAIALYEAEEEASMHTIELSKIKVEEARLREEIARYDTIEKVSFVKEMRRLHDERISDFAEVSAFGHQNRYVLMNLLGKGGFAEVWKAFDLVEGRYVAVKIHRLDKSWSSAQIANYNKCFRRELEIHRQVKHNRITSLYDIQQLDEWTFISVMEYSAGNDLDTHLKSVVMLKEPDARCIIMQVISALRHLATMKDEGGADLQVIHYDLKPANIIFHSSLSSCLDIKVTDFGLSKMVHYQGNSNSDPSIELTSQGTGTYWYLPPECFDTSRQPLVSPKVDIWSVGVIFFQFLYGKRPFAEGKSQAQIWKSSMIPTLARQGVEFPDRPVVSEGAKDIIRKCLTADPNERPDVWQLSNEHYFRGDKVKRNQARKAPPPTVAAVGLPPAHMTSSPSTAAPQVPLFGEQ